MRILVVDDRKAMRLILRRHLVEARLPDLELVEASNAERALEAETEERFDLVFCDWDLGGPGGGVALLEKLRAEHPDVRLGFVTTRTAPDLVERALDAGGLFLIVKPFAADAFDGLLTSVL